jgi:all-trans-retinol 13,14-reductase
VAVVLSHAEEYARFFGAPRGRRPQAYIDLKRERLSQFAQGLAEACPELAGLAPLDGATPLTLRDYLHAPQGGMYGTAHTLDQFNPLPVTRIPNVYAAGQAVVAPGLMGAVISAFLACGFIVGHDTLLNEVRLCVHDA